MFKISMASKACPEELVGEDAGLWKAVHAATYFHVGITIKGFFRESIMCNDVAL